MSGTSEPALPSGWAYGKLAQIATIELGQSPPSSTYNKDKKGLPFFQGKAEFGDLYPNIRLWCSQPKKIALSDDILLSVRAPVGPTNIAPEKCCIGRGLAAIRPETGLSLKYLLYAFRRYSDELNVLGTGTTFKAISGKIVREFAVPVAPSDEQTRIAEALDELFSDLDAAIAALERARDRLNLYRASLLKAAVQGTLTTDWHTAHPHAETASELLQRCLAERRQRWEEQQIRKFAEKGKAPPQNWRAKYKEPVSVDVTDLPPLPDGWCWTSLDALIVEGPQNGVYLPKTKYGCGTEILRIEDFQNGWVRDRNELKRVMAEGSDLETYAIRSGDLIINRVNSMSHLGKCLIASEALEGVLFESNMMRAALVSEIDPKFIQYYLHSLFGRSRLTKSAKWAVNQASINQQDVRLTPVPLPSYMEQKLIVDTVEDQISVVDHVEADLNARWNVARGLRQAILHRAFTGSLVRQDPNDEPAAELLRRIDKEREALAREAATRRAARIKNGARAKRRGRPRKTVEEVVR